MHDAPVFDTPAALQIGAFAAAVDGARLPPKTRDICRQLMIDVAGLCVAARDTDYVRACLASVLSDGPDRHRPQAADERL